MKRRSASSGISAHGARVAVVTLGGGAAVRTSGFVAGTASSTAMMKPAVAVTVMRYLAVHEDRVDGRRLFAALRG
jgi:hypothetical protein